MTTRADRVAFWTGAAVGLAVLGPLAACAFLPVLDELWRAGERVVDWWREGVNR